MESRNLFTFLVVVEEGGFTRAAQRLDYAQSSITAQIQALEAELGTPLFDRIGKKIVLTDAGRKLLPYAQEIAKMHALAKDAVHSVTEMGGTLMIGAPESLAAYRLPAVLREYRERYPNVKITLKPGLCWELKDQLRSGQLDLAFLLQPEAEDKELHTELLVEEEMALIAPPGHPLAGLEHVEPAHLRQETILHTEAGCTYRALFEQHLNSCGIFPDPSLEFWNIEAIKQCVMTGLGLSLLPLVTVQNELKEGKLLRLNWDDSLQRVSTQVVYHTKKWQSPALSELLRIISQHAAGWRQKPAPAIDCSL
ncbi:LysR family transcriptional regulator [Paenibacillus jiagnxiensis]|uniref:LysR family transcriptional regulator n=1 Tax=Paenibacillus jiagnxiensis TaxID=3228926 RepID=UPI0033BD1AC2